MRLAGPYGTLQHLVKRAPYWAALHHLRPFSSTVSTRQFSTEPLIERVELRQGPNPNAKNVAVLGGGITGLTTAFHLSRLIPDAKITIYEKQERLGGWLDSEIVEVDGGEVLFEWGPRTLRPDHAGAGGATIWLLSHLGIDPKDIVRVSKTEPAAYNRFIYYPDHLVKLPGPRPGYSPPMTLASALWSAFTEPIFKGLLGGLIAEFSVKPRPSNWADESIGDFVRRRFGATAADNLLSAVLHGIYAGDSYKLSARTIMPLMWYAETRDPEGNGIFMELADLGMKGHAIMPYKNVRFQDLVAAAKDWKQNDPLPMVIWELLRETSVYTFAQGLGYLARRLEDALEAKENVVFKKNSSIKELKYDKASKKTTVTSENESKRLEYDYVVSTLSPNSLLNFTKSTASEQMQLSLTEAAKPKAVNVAVVNLYYSNPNLIPSSKAGFGYLIPRSIDVDQNPERALGVIFGSETSGPRGKDAIVRPHNLEREQILPGLKNFIRDAKSTLESGQPNQKLGLEEMTEQAREKLQQDIEFAEKEVERIEKGSAELVVRQGQDTAPGTKLTVMLGGHWWDSWTEEDLPTEEQVIDMAKSVLARHLKIMEAPLVAKARINKECIPQYHVGYRQRMASVHRSLMEDFQGRLKVAGPWWQGGVGINDCIQKAHETAFAIREDWEEETGLKDFTAPEKWVLGDKRTGKFVLDPMQS